MRLNELTQAWRSLRRTPWYAATAAGVIALGIALSTTVFAIVDGALFKPLPYAETGRLFAVSTGWSRLPEPFRPFGVMSPAQVYDLRTSLPEVRMTAFYIGDTRLVGERDYVDSARVDAAFFDVIGMRPAIGGFAPADFETDSPARPALISQGFWQRRLGRDPSVIGRLMVNDAGEGIRVAGVLPEGFVLPFPSGRVAPELLTPLVETLPRSQGSSLCVLVRLSGATSPREASDRLSVAAARWATDHPPARIPPDLPERSRILRSPFDRVGLDPIREALTGGVREKAWVVLTAAGAVVLLACLNVACLTIARVRDRWRDLSVRRSLGARSADLMRLLVVESAVVSALGTAVGVAGAYSMLATTVRLLGASSLTVLKPPAIDLRVLAFAAGVAAAAVAFVTLFSARAASRVGLREAVAEGGGTTRRARARVSIVTIEVAVALVVAVGAALVAGSLLRVWSEDPGFETRDVGVISISAPQGASGAAIEELVAMARRLPGVAGAGGSGHPLLEHAFNGSEFDRPAGVSDVPPGSRFPIESVPVTSGYLEAGGLAVREGRLPTEAEFTSGAAVIVVTETVARQFWPGRPAVGQSLVNDGREYRVIGVVPDARFMALDLEPQGEIFWPVAAMTRPRVGHMLIRLDAGTSRGLGLVVAELRRRCPTCWFRSARMLTDALADTIQPRRFSAWLFGAFGLAALIIVGTGLLGLVAMTTGRRTREIGVRMALGAMPGTIVRQLLGEQTIAVALGLVSGGVLSAWLVRFVQSYLYKTSVYDPWSWSVAIGALVGVAMMGTFVPSYRASRTDPVRALKVE